MSSESNFTTRRQFMVATSVVAATPRSASAAARSPKELMQSSVQADPTFVKAMEAVRAAIPTASTDPERPVYHFHPPANWNNDPNGTLIVAGEQREWEGVEYPFDANTAGERKGMILVGHWVSEDQGMRLCADWLKSFISEVPVEWIPAGDPFWRP
jgi:hypothetical protein